MELDHNECKILFDHLVEKQEGCYFIGDIVQIVEKLKEELK